ncbi:hypothetical protein BDR05DRAFT_971108, partial [Suillus weaverae]
WNGTPVILFRKTYIDPDLVPGDSPPRSDSLRPPELITVVLRAAPSEPAADSPACLAFDPQFPRGILPDQTHTWAFLEGLLTSLKNVNDLANTAELTTWEVAGHLQLWCPRPHSRFPYVRSITQSAFWDGVLVLNMFALKHVVVQFFRETLDISYDAFTQNIMTRRRARRRRFFAKSLFNWHELFVVFMDACVRLAPLQDQKKLDHVRRARVAVLIYGCLSLYTNEERVFANWYLVQVLEMHLPCIDQLMPGMSSGSNAYFELSYQLQFLTALQSLSITIFAIAVKQMTFSWRRTRLKFLRRCEWAFTPEYEDIGLQSFGHPSFTKFATACESMQEDKQFSLDSITLAIEVLSRLLTSPDGWAGRWGEERKKVRKYLVIPATDSHPAQVRPEAPGGQALATCDAKALKRDADAHPWLPIISAFPPAPP